MGTMQLSPSSLWQHVVANYDPYTIKFTGVAVVNLFSWWIPCVIFVSLEYIAPSFARRHKMQPSAKSPTASQLRRCILVAFGNHLLALAEFIALSHLFATRAYPAGNRFDARLPSMSRFLGEFLLSFMLREIMFYYGHRAFHWRPLYRKIHKVHHEFTAPVAFASQYAHPIEYLTSDTLPILLPPMMLRTHVVSMWAFTAGTLFTSTVIHSGYDFFYKAARMHDRHHEGANAYFGAFGALGLLDWAHGTVEKNRKVKS
ncbi:hypothetical protein CP532_3882 [Ophiocordyceps camponoti-leonardi (nom. inval.)]|nr:hypothetical protein CP532_3882 [Ophiocordyceps camponoti-leonardi (nom. inval.)]